MLTLPGCQQALYLPPATQARDLRASPTCQDRGQKAAILPGSEGTLRTHRRGHLPEPRARTGSGQSWVPVHLRSSQGEGWKTDGGLLSPACPWVRWRPGLWIKQGCSLSHPRPSLPISHGIGGTDPRFKAHSYHLFMQSH